MNYMMASYQLGHNVLIWTLRADLMLRAKLDATFQSTYCQYIVIVEINTTYQMEKLDAPCRFDAL